MSINYGNVVRRMLQAIPEVHPFYEKEIEWSGEEEPGPHIVFGDVLNPYLIDLLKQDNQEEELERIFSFFEEMAVSSDIKVQEVLAVTVMERLGDDPTVLKKAEKYMGPKTRMISDEIERFWGRR